MIKKYSVFILEDSVYAVDVFVGYLKRMDRAIFQGTAETVTKALSACRENPPDIVIVDAHLNSNSTGIDFVKRYSRFNEKSILIGFTRHHDKIKPLERAGCHLVFNKKYYESEENFIIMIEEAINYTEYPPIGDGHDYTELDEDEKKILIFWTKGLSQNEICLEMGWSNKTDTKRCSKITSISKSIFLKLGARNQAHAVYNAMNARII